MRTASNLSAAQDTDSANQGPDLLQSGLANISWFFPQGFEKIATIDNPAWREFRGREFSYKFFKATEPLSIADKWLLARRELRFGRIYAPDVYLGLRLLRLEQGVPEWVSFKPSSFILGKNAPSDIYDLAVVARRGKSWRGLVEWLENQSETVDFKRTAAQILAVIRSMHYRAASEVGGRVSVSLTAYVNSILELGSHKTTRSVVGLNFPEYAEDRLLDLFEKYRQISLNKDYVKGTRTHGAMLASNVAVRGRTLSLQFCNVSNSTDQTRTHSHAYLDIATLVADLAARGFEELAFHIEQQVCEESGSARRMLFEIFKLGEGLRLASSALSGDDDLLVNSDLYLLELLKSTFALNSPGLIVLRAKGELAHQLQSWFQELENRTTGIRLWDSNKGLMNGVTVYIPELGDSIDKQLIISELMKRDIPSMEILVTGSAYDRHYIKTWPPVGAIGQNCHVISSDPLNPYCTIVEILNKFRALQSSPRLWPSNNGSATDYQAFGFADEIY